MSKFRIDTLLPFDSEIQRTCQKNRKIRRKTSRLTPNATAEGEERAKNNKALWDYVLPSVTGIQSVIRKLAIQENNSEIKPATLQMYQPSAQFGGLPNEDSNTHITNF